MRSVDRYRGSKLRYVTQCYLPPGSRDFTAFTLAEAHTRFSNPRGMQGWVDMGGGFIPLLFTCIIWSPVSEITRLCHGFLWRNLKHTTSRRVSLSGYNDTYVTTLILEHTFCNSTRKVPKWLLRWLFHRVFTLPLHGKDCLQSLENLKNSGNLILPNL